MKWRVIKDILGWGLLIWLIGYALGIILFFVVPSSLVGWIIMPIGVIITTWVLLKKIKSKSIKYYFLLGITWTLVAAVFDYLFLVKVFKPSDGYYKPDVYIYYFLTFFLPITIGWYKLHYKSK